MKLTDFNESFKHYKVKHKKTGKEYKVTAMHDKSALEKARAQHGGTASRYTGTSTSDFEIVEGKESFKKILDILTIQKKELSNLVHSFALVNECKKVIDNLDDVSLTLNSLIVSCLEYLTNSIIIQQNISREMYEFAVKVEIAMADISSGMRPQVVLSNLSLEV